MNVSVAIKDCSIFAANVSIPSISGFNVDLTQKCNTHFYKTVDYLVDTNSVPKITTAFVSIECVGDDSGGLRSTPFLIYFCLLVRFLMNNRLF
jgi:hypothetical protein